MNLKLHILVVDDDRRMTSTLADILALRGYETTEAYSGPEALGKIKETSFDCVLTDVKMPGMNGVELFEELRQTQPGLPVVLMTAYAADELIHRGLEGGAAGVLNKPLDIHQLLGFLAALGREHIVTVVDDDPAFCKTLGEILERRGFRVTLITNPYTEVDQMVVNTQIVLLDMKLNGFTGYDVLKEIRLRHPGLPVLLVTGYRQEMTTAVQQALEIDAFACLYKPLVIPELLQKLAEIRSARMKELLKKG
jgi:two-component system, NtrC family, response regulator HydG